MLDKVTLNISGERYEVLETTITGPHHTRLAALTTEDPEYDRDKREYFFERNPQLFPFILEFCRTGRLHFPHFCCGAVVEEELAFWGIDEDYMEPCCWGKYREFDDVRDSLRKLGRTFDSCDEVPNTRQTSRTSWKKTVRCFLERPHSSRPAQIWAGVYLVLVCTSVTISCLYTVPWPNTLTNSLMDPSRTSINLTNSQPINNASAQNASSMAHVNNAVKIAQVKLRTTVSVGYANLSKSTQNKPFKFQKLATIVPNPTLVAIDILCNSIFSIELILRFMVWHKKKLFLNDLFNLIDIFAVIPSFLFLIFHLIFPTFWWQLSDKLLYLFLFTACILKAIQTLKLSHYNSGLQILVLTLWASMREILLLLALTLICMVIFSTVIFFAELSSDNKQFRHIPDSFWWAIITMTTVGYGDITPSTPVGYLVASVCAMTGVLLSGLIIPVIANNFTTYYEAYKLKNRKQVKRVL